MILLLSIQFHGFRLINKFGEIAALRDSLDSVRETLVIQNLNLLEDAEAVIMEALAHGLFLMVGAAQLVNILRQHAACSKHHRRLFRFIGIV